LNWFLNPNVKVRRSIATDHRGPMSSGGDGWAYLQGTRLVLEFSPWTPDGRKGLPLLVSLRIKLTTLR
jgi:hypothetical protein